LGLRQTLNEKPLIAGSAAAVLLVGSLVYLFKDGCSGPREIRVAGTPKMYFTVDDGQHWFADEATKIPPFDHDGKPAVRARIFECPDGKQFCAYLERYGDATKKKLEQAVQDTNAKGRAGPMAVSPLFIDTEVKRPGDKEWVKQGVQNIQKATEIRTPKCPDGTTDGLRPVLPPI
jgi:hypothetical protein